jgi:hypothetical protein
LPATRGSHSKAILIVIDGLTPAMFEDAVERRTAPALAELHERGSYRRAVSVFPSLTPVCLSSLATGAYPETHGIPHLVWYHRGEGRVVEYGSSFAALRRAGARRGILDAIFRMNEEHLAPHATTVYEAVERAGGVAAAVNMVCYRGDTRHAPRVPGLTRPAYGPKRFFYFNLYASDLTGAPFRIGGRQAGANDAYAAAVGRWLVTRDGFDLLVYYLPDYDYASHAVGPDAAHDALARSDAAVRALIEAAGGIDRLLERYAIVVCSDHGQTRVTRPVSLHDAFRGENGVVVTASNRAGMVYDLRGGRARELARRLDGHPAVETALFLEDGELVARREGGEGPDVLDDYPDGIARALGAVRNPNAGDVLVSAAPGYEFTDLAGRHHGGGGSHGSLTAGDSEVPMLVVGAGEPPAGITGVAPLLLERLGVERASQPLTHVA